MRKLIFTVSLLTYSISCFAQSSQVWSIEKCIRHAIDHNIQVKQAMTSVDVNKLNKEQAKFNYLPSLSASVGYNASFGRSLDQTTYQYIDNKTVNNVNGSLSLGTQVFAGMSKLYNLKKSDLNLLASIQDVERIKNEITVALAAAYLQVLYNKEQISTSRNQIEVISEQITRTRKLVDAGSLPLGAVLELEAQLATEKYTLVSHQNNLDNSTLTITQLLELPDMAGFEIETPDVESIVAEAVIADVKSVNEQAQNLPQITASELRLKAAEMDVKIAKSRYYPTLNFNASYGSSYSDARQRPQLTPTGEVYYTGYPFFNQLGDNANAGLALSMQIPIFNGLTTRRNVHVSKLNVQSKDYDLKLAQNKLYKEIQQAYTDATGALNRFTSASTGVQSSQESFRYAEQKFSAGATTSVDYVTAKNNLLNAQSAMLQAKYEYIFRVKLLDFYKGIPITL